MSSFYWTNQIRVTILYGTQPKNMDREFANTNRKELQGIKSNFKV